MRVWVDFGNSPHVALLGEVVDELWKQGDDVFLTARGTTLRRWVWPLKRWPDVVVMGGGARRVSRKGGRSWRSSS